MPGWNEPVAIGTRSPIRKVAFSLFRTRICGFWSTLLLLSVARKVKVAEDGMATAKLPMPLMPPVFRVNEPPLELALAPLVEVPLLVLPIGNKPALTDV